MKKKRTAAQSVLFLIAILVSISSAHAQQNAGHSSAIQNDLRQPFSNIEGNRGGANPKDTVEKAVLRLDLSPITNQEMEEKEDMMAPIFPEPMVFDLVRPLGAKKGELEVNTLFITPMRRGKRQLNWAPEIEWAFANGYAVEIELPMLNNQIEAYKMAVQGTFSFNTNKTFIHGWQWISEYIIHEKFLESSLLYLAGFDLGDGVSTFVMFGGRNNAPMRSGEELQKPDSRWDMLFNATLNYKIRRGTIVSVENNLARQIGSGYEYRIIPQLNQRISDHMVFQGGIGYEWYLNESFPIASCRFVVEI